MKRRSFFAWLFAAAFGWSLRSRETLPLYIDPYLTDNHAWYLKDPRVEVEILEWWWRDKDGVIYHNRRPTAHKQMPYTIFGGMEEL